ncbi:SMODS domain-containing nucleotidyltransferase [Aeromonas sanarellii]|uniref:SMODS domain-containing nucleotidyltransferase n=1 Tax=Aeromonas sanarellii TaxID=633415 RepID=UPI0038D0EC9F
MSISDKFSTFCSSLRMSDETVDEIRYRYKRITKQLNMDFWDSNSDTNNSLYVGSYGRGTAIHVSDIDVIFKLPYEKYTQYNAYQGNGQSALLQEVKASIQKTYRSYMRADGQVIKIDFTDGICFEIVPAFINTDDSYTYPDTNNGGSWKTTDPKAEIDEMNTANKNWNKNLKRLARMARAWKDQWDVPIGGLLIDTLAYRFLSNWEYKDKSFVYYDWMTRDFFKFLSEQDEEQKYWLAPGSLQYVWRKGKFEYKAKQCYNIAIKAIEHEVNNQEYSANKKWREIYGTKFPN